MRNGRGKGGDILARPKGTTKEPGRFEWLKMFPEMQWLDDENMAVRAAGFDNDGVRSLMAAICMKAIIDYKNVINRNDEEAIKIKEECLEFFDSEMFQFYVNGMEVEEVVGIIARMPRELLHRFYRQAMGDK